MDDTGNGRWLTYSELATIRGITGHPHGKQRSGRRRAA